MVKRLILMAAGKGERLRPITVNTPKPLVRINGVRIIDTILDAAIKNGIEDIYIVRGYLGEQFDQLTGKYPYIKFIENPDYEVANNISSVFAARELLEDAFVCEADLFLENAALMDRNQENSNYLAVPTEHTDDWCFRVNDDGVITELAVGADHCHHMFGLSYWTKEDGKKLASCVEQIYMEKNGKQLYWDEVALKYFSDEFKVHVRTCTFDDITEIDTVEELQALDARYAM